MSPKQNLVASKTPAPSLHLGVEMSLTLQNLEHRGHPGLLLCQRWPASGRDRCCGGSDHQCEHQKLRSRLRRFHLSTRVGPIPDSLGGMETLSHFLEASSMLPSRRAPGPPREWLVLPGTLLSHPLHTPDWGPPLGCRAWRVIHLLQNLDVLMHP